LQAHPEIRQMLHDFVASCLTLKPDNVQDHARAFFAQYQSDLGGSANAPALQPVEPVVPEPSAVAPVSEAEAPAAVESSASSAAPLFRPLVVCGPSGVGKGTILNMLLQRHGDHFAPIPSHTSRAPRDGEVDGVNYHFSNLEDMQRDIDAGLFVEYATVHGNLYGKSRKAVEAVQATGKVSVIELDVQGAQTIKQSDMNAYFVFIEPPSIDHLEERLRGRGTEVCDVI
jgi:guanylate kinase